MDKTNVTISLATGDVQWLRSVAEEQRSSVNKYLERLVRAERARHAVRTLDAAREIPADVREAAEADWEARHAA